jgi:hypothetical protein
MIAGVEGQPYDEHTREWGCLLTNRDFLFYGAIAVLPCYRPKGSKEPPFKNLPVAEETCRQVAPWKRAAPWLSNR